MISKSVSCAIVGIGAALLLAGCAPKMQWSPTQPSPRPMLKRHLTTVEVFQDQAPPRPHQEVGVITAQKARSTKTDVRVKLTDDIRKKAATLGCDAIHVRDVSQAEIPGSKKQPPMTIQGGCLMWNEDAATAGATTAAGATAAAAATTAPGAGCANDMHCKGDRICENGQCVSPPSPSGATPSEGVSSDKACEMDTDCPGDEICQSSKCKLP